MCPSQCFALIALLSGAGPAWADAIEVHDALAPATSSLARTGAAYMVLHNHGDSDDALLDLRSDAARLVQLHTTAMSVDGVMSMSRLTDPLPLPAGGEVLLAPGGTHIMFMGLVAPFAPGDLIPVTLVFANAGEVEVMVPVAADRSGDPPVDQMDHD